MDKIIQMNKQDVILVRTIIENYFCCTIFPKGIDKGLVIVSSSVAHRSLV